jgi:hypothetical protein
MLVKAFERAKHLVSQGIDVPSSDNFELLFKLNSKDITIENSLDLFISLDDADVFTSLKRWTKHSDKVLSILANGLLNRQLFKLHIQTQTIDDNMYEQEINNIAKTLNISVSDAHFLCYKGKTSNHPYNLEKNTIKIKHKNGDIKDILESSVGQILNNFENMITKNWLCFYKISI